MKQESAEDGGDEDDPVSQGTATRPFLVLLLLLAPAPLIFLLPPPS